MDQNNNGCAAGKTASRLEGVEQALGCHIDFLLGLATRGEKITDQLYGAQDRPDSPMPDPPSCGSVGVLDDKCVALRKVASRLELVIDALENL